MRVQCHVDGHKNHTSMSSTNHVHYKHERLCSHDTLAVVCNEIFYLSYNIFTCLFSTMQYFYYNQLIVKLIPQILTIVYLLQVDILAFSQNELNLLPIMTTGFIVFIYSNKQ